MTDWRVSGSYSVCGIRGHDHPGEEVRAEVMRVDAEPLHWEVRGRCGFASDFDYTSEPLEAAG